jgi:Ca2+-binding EF-hand superfamily protein
MGWMTRLDTNGNGMLDPDESQGRARMFLDRTGLDLSRPIPMDRVTRAFEEMRNRRAEEGGRGDDEGRRGRGEEGGSGDRAAGKAETSSLVPGFGETDLFDPVPGFGDLGEKYAVAIDEEDRQEALRTMGRSDVNQDGVLDADEIRTGRWSDDPLQTDRNRDGKLTLTELALRYAIRRVEREGSGGAERSTARNGGGNRGGRPPSPGAGPETGQGSGPDRMLQMMFGRYDRNGNGVLDRDEWNAFPADPSRYDANQDGKISREEFAAAMAARFGGRRGGGDGSDGERGRWFARREGEEPAGGDPASAAAPEPAAASAARKSYRIRTGAERLSDVSGLPEWFGRTDANGDGQVSMAEYSTSWNEQVAADFAQFDLNNDGIATPAECVKATEAGAVQGAPSTASVSSASVERPRDRRRDERRDEPAAAPVTAAADASDAVPASAAPSNAGADSQKYIKYAVSFIRRYDTNKDGVLTEDEWSKMNTDYSAADTDQDGRITPVELAAAFMKK